MESKDRADGNESLDLGEVETSFYLGDLDSEEMPGIALGAGCDGPALLELARISSPIAQNVGDLFERALGEMGRSPLPKEEAGLRVARNIARKIVCGEMNPYEGASLIWTKVWSRCGRPRVDPLRRARLAVRGGSRTPTVPLEGDRGAGGGVDGRARGTLMPIYLDYNATTPLDERVLDAMLPYLKGNFGNPSSATHAYGWTASAAVDLAREEVAESIAASREEITFTAGATESDNMALLGLLGPGDHLVTAATEHEAILETAHHLARAGVRVTVLPVDRHGVVHPDALIEVLQSDTRLVSIMLANNETGTLNPVRELAEVAHERGIPFHTDAAQAFCKVPVDVEDLGVDLMSISAHKCYGPKGVGALYVRRRPRPGVRSARPEPILFGGGQERGIRSGTLNVPGIVGLGRAASLGAAALPEEAERIRALRDRLHDALDRSVPGLRLNGSPEYRLPGTLNVSFPGVDVGELLGALPDVAASAGSACASLDAGPSHVLEAMGLKDGSWATVRLSLGRLTTGEEVEKAAEMIVRAAADLRTVDDGSGLEASRPSSVPR